MEKTIHANYKHKLEYTHIYLYIFLVGSDNTRKDFPFFSIKPNPSHLKYMLKDCPATKKKNSFWTLMEGKKTKCYRIPETGQYDDIIIIIHRLPPGKRNGE